MNDLSHQDRLHLKNMMNESNYQDNTDHIRKVKHSDKIRHDIEQFALFRSLPENMALKTEDPALYMEKCRETCNFLFCQYTDIFHRLVKDELNVGIMMQLLSVLKRIEEGQLDQNEGSIMVGKILKNLYIDSAVKRADHLDKEFEKKEDKVPTTAPVQSISWKEYKNYIDVSNKKWV